MMWLINLVYFNPVILSGLFCNWWILFCNHQSLKSYSKIFYPQRRQRTQSLFLWLISPFAFDENHHPYRIIWTILAPGKTGAIGVTWEIWEICGYIRVHLWIHLGSSVDKKQKPCFQTKKQGLKYSMANAFTFCYGGNIPEKQKMQHHQHRYSYQSRHHSQVLWPVRG